MADALPQDPVVLDACCVITLYASGEMAGILKVLPGKVLVAEYVVSHEALAIYSDPDHNGEQAKQTFKLDTLINDGLLTVATIESDDEANTFIDLAAALDDGEAMTAAIAIHRNWAIATDDKKATSLLKARAPQIQIVSTPELIRYWAETTNIRPDEIREVLNNIQVRGRYWPGQNHSLHEWWQSHVN